MYQPDEFRERRLRLLHDHVRRHSFGILVSNGPDGPTASHLPFLLSATADDGNDRGVLTGHLARRNLQAHDIADGDTVLAVFPGPQSYVSARWYTAEPDVPTWNYTAVNARGVFRRLAAGDTMAVLRRTVDTLEGNDADAWRLDSLDDDLTRGLARGVVGFDIEITELDGGFKLSQDKLADDVHAVVGGLSAAGEPTALAVARTMRDLGVTGRRGAASTDPTTDGAEGQC